MRQLNEMHMTQLRASHTCAGKSFVFGEGRIDRPNMMMIGEAPGANEVLQGRPFVGAAGKNLDHFLEIIGASRESIYITNVVKIRPTLLGEHGKENNRTPTFDEVALFLPWLKDEIEAVEPQILVTLGNTPLKALVGGAAGIGGLHGRFLKYLGIIPLYPLYHPAAIIYNRALADVYEADVVRLRELMRDRLPGL